jgi:crotonobetainyl-CoA:carnitine CoA-transferase CaiB-like acyl-CoA transferase
MTRPYENITVLDLTHVLAGPFCAYQFALLGADVIKIEPPDGPDCSRGRGPDPSQNNALRGLTYQVQGSNKRAITLNLKSTQGQDILKKLVKNADILIENYRTGALVKLGLGYDKLKDINPALIYCSLTGFGDIGERASVNAYDNVIQATSGIIAQSAGHKPGVSFVDYAAGYNAAFAISSALHQRSQTGKGTYISSSMFEVAMMMMAPEVAAAQYPIKSVRDKEAGICAYETADGILMLGAFTPKQNKRLWEIFEKLGYQITPDLKSPDSWETLWQLSNSIKYSLENILRDKTAVEWQDIFHENLLPAEKQRSLSEALEDQQLKDRGYFYQGEKEKGDSYAPILPIAAFQFENGPEITSPPPDFNQHTHEILCSLGYNDDDIARLKKEGVIA